LPDKAAVTKDYATLVTARVVRPPGLESPACTFTDSGNCVVSPRSFPRQDREITKELQICRVSPTKILASDALVI
jgi:hypothetical protein